MNPLELGRLRVSAVVERAGPTRPTWLLPDATPEAVERHHSWLAPHFLDDKGRFLQSIHSFVVQAPGVTMLVDTCVGNDKDRGGRAPFHMMQTPFLEDLSAAGFPPEYQAFIQNRPITPGRGSITGRVALEGRQVGGQHSF